MKGDHSMQNKSRILSIIQSLDFGLAESARDDLTQGEIRELISLYATLSDWSQKDLVLHMLQDQASPDIVALFQDGLNSPSVETQAVALHVTSAGQISFESLLRGGFVCPELVREALNRRG